MSIRCSLRASDLDDDDVQRLTQELCRTIREETEVDAQLETGASVTGDRGDPITLGTIALTFLSGGAAVALIKVLEVYVGRKPSLEVELTQADGSKFSVKAQDLAPKFLSQTQRLLERFVQSAK
ncbi:MAG: hypothetical protein M3Y72_00175 [Acidobacteriota bacterium]|nr:hypothetical protein [Acidobacteriota bacterium]